MDEGFSRNVQGVFVKLFEQGLIYRGNYLVNWDPENETAISDEEVENIERDGNLWYIKYPLADGSGHVTIATTRPETMLGDTGVAVHPEDERYHHLIGKSILLPFVNREIPIIADEYALHIPREALVHRKTLVTPIARRAHPPLLLEDNIPVLLFPFPDLLDERLSSEVVT